MKESEGKIFSSCVMCKNTQPIKKKGMKKTIEKPKV